MLAQVVTELDELVNLGRTPPDEAGATGIGRLDERTAVGKNFAGVAARLGLDGTLLTRAQELPEPYAILDGDKRHVVVRAELLQLLSVAETAFLFATLLEQSPTGIRLLASLRPEDRLRLVPALAAAWGRARRRCPGPRGGAGRIRTRSPAGRRRVGRPPPRPRRRCRGRQPAPTRAARGSRRVGLVGAADLRFAARVITRLDDTLPKMQTVGRIDDLDEFMPARRRCARCSASPPRTPSGGRSPRDVTR